MSDTGKAELDELRDMVARTLGARYVGILERALWSVQAGIVEPGLDEIERVIRAEIDAWASDTRDTRESVVLVIEEALAKLRTPSHAAAQAGTAEPSEAAYSAALNSMWPEPKIGGTVKGVRPVALLDALRAAYAIDRPVSTPPGESEQRDLGDLCIRARQLIQYVNGGDWARQTETWRDIASMWMDDYRKIVNARGAARVSSSPDEGKRGTE